MRITNNMMLNTTSSNINGNKLNVNNLNNQMSSQKKIQRPSEDPVIAIRALRLRSTLSQINQYYEKNIPDAQTWLEVTETAFKNMNKILKDVRTQCVTGTNSYLTADDRSTILKSLTALKSQLYSEGNSDDAGRTVFTGFKTNSQLTFMEDETDNDGVMDNGGIIEDSGTDNNEMAGGNITVTPAGNGNNTTAAPGTTDANGTGNDGTVSGELGDSVKDLGDGVGNAVDDIGNAVGNAVEGR